MFTLQRFVVSALLIIAITFAFFSQTAEAVKGPKITHKVFFDITNGDESMGRIVIGFTARPSPRPSRTSALWLLERRDTDTKTRPSTVLSRDS